VSLQAGAQPFLTFSGAETRSRGFKREEMSEAAACSGFVVEKEEQKSVVKSL